MPDHQAKMLKKVGRPRDEKTHQAILHAALELVADKGLQGTSIEAIARRAKVAKTTIYRRWPSKEDLILDVLRELHVEVPMIDTGNLREDWVRFLSEATQTRSSNPLLIQLFFRLYAESGAYPQFMQTLFDQVFKERYQHALTFIEKAKARGEIRPDVDPFLVLMISGAPILYGIVISALAPGQFSTDGWSEQIINMIMEGIVPRSPSSQA